MSMYTNFVCKARAKKRKNVQKRLCLKTTAIKCPGMCKNNSAHAAFCEYLLFKLHLQSDIEQAKIYAKIFSAIGF